MRTIPELSYSKILTRIQMDTATGCWLCAVERSRAYRERKKQRSET